MDAPPHPELTSLDKVSSSIRGKFQFMDYLVRAAVADVERYQAEADPGTQIFLRQLIEMHAASLSQECGNLRDIDELCGSLQSVISSPAPGATS